MRRIKIHRWKGLDASGKETDDDTVTALTALINVMNPKNMPRGLEQFRLFKRLNESFEKANEYLELEEAEYKFLRSIIEKDIPSIWAMNKDIMAAIESFVDAKEE